MDEKSLEILEGAAAGDPETIREIKEWAAKSTDFQGLERLSQIIREAEEEKRKTEAEFWSDLVDLKNAVNAKPANAVEALKAMERRARAFGTCETVQVLGLWAHRWMVLDEIRAAEETLREAWGLALSCRLAETAEAGPCAFYLHRRQGLLELASGRHTSGLAEIQCSLDGFRLWGQRPTHDVNGDGEGSSLYARGEALFHLRDYDGSIADFTVCLERFHPSRDIWSNAYHNLAYALARTGCEGRKKAHELLQHQRLSMRSHEKTVQGATFLWVDGQLAYALGIRRDRAMKRMRRALAFFASEGMPDEYRGVSLDIARAYYPRRDLIVNFLNETKGTREGLIRSEYQKRMFAEIYDLADGCPGLDTLSLLDAILRKLRDAVTREASLPPCLLTAS